MTLCWKCQRFSIHSFSSDPDGVRAYKLQDVREGAEAGCEFCALLLATVQDDLDITPYEPYQTWIRLNFSKHNEQYGLGLAYNRLHVKVVNTVFPKLGSDIDDGGKEYQLHVAADPASPAAQSGDVIGRYLGDNPTSDLHISTIGQWLEDCTLHQACSHTVSGTTKLYPKHSPLPTRCIDVQNENLSLADTIGMHGAYVTLSHRWDQETAKCSTTLSNVLERKVRLDINALSIPFQHAVAFTRLLGLRYLWIDSICIIQSGDDGVDWSNEALKMGQYYQYSMLTVAVTSSAGDGFLYTRPERPFTTLVRLPFRDKTNVQRGYFYVYKRFTPPSQEFLSSVWNSELLGRGWVFQEWLLSRRVAYFTPLQIYFECQSSGPESECRDLINPAEIPPNIDSSFMLKKEITVTETSIETTWYKVLEMYSRLQLTKTEDRIIALGGIAAEIRESYTVLDIRERKPRALEYISGLWLRDIHYGLLWLQKANPGKYTRLPGIPSWSWASLQLEVKWPTRHQPMENALQITRLASRNKIYDCSENFSEPAIFSQRRLDDTSPSALSPSTDADENTPSDVFDVNNMFTVLHIRAHLLSLFSRGPFHTKADLRLAAWATGVSVVEEDLVPWINSLQAGQIDPEGWKAALGLDFQLRPWQAICSRLTPDIIGGWGSFELTLEKESDVTVQAIHVSTEKRVPGGLAFGTLRTTHEVFDVLFVEEVELNRYRRVGVGKIFDGDIIAQFRKGELRDIELI